MNDEHSGLLIAALVAIVAVVGLVILFKGGAQGAAVCPAGQELAQVANPGGQATLMCRDMGPVNYIPQSAQMGGSANAKDTFQTPQDNRDRRYDIAQRTWEY